MRLLIRVDSLNLFQVKTLMKIPQSILLKLASAGFVLFMLECKQPSDPPCGIGAPYHAEKSLGTTVLSNDFEEWLRINQDTIELYNSNGAAFTVIVDQQYGAINENSLGFEPSNIDCDDDTRIYYNDKYDRVNFVSNKISIPIGLRRNITIDESQRTPIIDTVANKMEKVRFSIGKESFDFFIKDTLNAYKEFYVFFGNTYNDVLVCENSVVKAGAYPKKFILKRNIGLVGFELSNNELWKRR